MIEAMNCCPIWNRNVLKMDTPYECPYEEDNNCGLFYNEDGTCNLLNMTMRAKMQKEADHE